MKQIVIGDVLNQAWELTKKHWAPVLICMIGTYIITSIISSILGPNQFDLMHLQDEISRNQDTQYVLSQLTQMYSQAGPAALISNLIHLIIMVGVYQTLLNVVRRSSDFTFDAWKLPANLYVKVVVTDIIVGIICGIGFFCCIVPGIYLKARLQFTSYYLLEHQETGIGEALSASWNMTEGNAMNLSLLLVVFFFMGILGLLCCCVGLILVEIIVYLATVICYVTLAPETPKTDVVVTE